MDALRVAVSLLSSRKVQVALATFIVTLLAAFGLKDYPVEVIVAVIAAFAGLGGVVINSIKAEDVATKTAHGQITAAQISTGKPLPPLPSPPMPTKVTDEERFINRRTGEPL